MRPLTVALVLLVSAGAATAQTPGFWLVGLAPGATGGSVTGLSQDGSIAVGGTGNGSITPGFRWTQATGRYDFGLEAGMPAHTPAAAVNSTGNVMAGWALGAPFSTQATAYRRVGSGPLENLGILSGRVRSISTGISGDGSTVVGYSDSGLSSNGGEAFRWTPSGGMQGLGFLIPNGGGQSSALGISRDGSTIVGTSRQGGPGNTTFAFVWTEATGMQGLPALQGAIFPDRYAQAVNANGTVIVGFGHGQEGTARAVLWTGGNATDLGVVPGFSASAAYSVNDNGMVVGGNCSGPIDSVAFVWTPDTGMLTLADFLGNYGISVPSTYRPEYVQTISGDGLTFGGYGLNLSSNMYEGFVATIPAPGTLAVLLAPLLASRRRRARS